MKEISKVSKRIHLVAFLVAAALLVVLPSASASAASPWWQVLDGSRPTHLWVPESEVQEIIAPASPFSLSVGSNFAGGFNFPPFFPEATAANVQAALEGAYGAGDVEVTGGPGGTAPLIVTSIGADAGRLVAPIEASGATTKILKAGGSGRLVLTLTNLGNAPVDGTSTPVTIVDELPEGLEATGYEAVAGVQGSAGPVTCTLTASVVSCSFEGILPSYEAIEVEVFVSLVGEPHTQGAAGTISVSGGNAPSKSVPQRVVISPEEVPFGIERFSAEAEEEGGASAAKAGSHPFQLTTTIQLNSGPVSPAASRRDSVVDQPALPRNLRFTLPAGLVGNAAAVPQCSMATFLNGEVTNDCPDASAVGVASVTFVEPSVFGFIREAIPVFNLSPGNGEPARFGFTAVGNPVVIDTAVDPDNEYRIVASVNNTTQLAQFLSGTVSLWGVPGDPRHDSSRGWNCVFSLEGSGPCQRPTNLGEDAFLRQPVSCTGPLHFLAELEPWNVPIGSIVARGSFADDPLHSCNQIPFNPSIATSPSSKAAGASTGLAFKLEMPNAGLLDPTAIAEGQAKKVEVTLPEGMTVNPSQADGLAACSPAAYAQETVGSPPGAGCPEAAKIGSVQVTTPLLKEEARGAVYIAEPYDNPFGTLLALYLVAKIPERGILVKQAGEVELNPETGQLVTTFDNLPQIPFDSFELRFKEGSRAPLVTPPACGVYRTVAKFIPWSAADPSNPLPSEIVERASSFTVDQGPNGGPCPTGRPSFDPDFAAGSLHGGAGKYSPFSLRLTRKDGEQEFSRFSMKLPKGLIGKLAEIPFCSEVAIAAARARTGPNGGQEELDAPSCPAASQLGHTLVGAGVGPSLAYSPGKIYLAGPHGGAKLSIVAIATATVGPFDLGNVVIRQALRIDPETAQVTSDGSRSDPIPHILKGIVVHARDIQVNIDRERFVLNPTSCERMTVASDVFGSGLDFGSAADDQLATVAVPFQAADCAGLGFKPKLSLRLLGGTKRGEEPRLRAILKARKGDANIGRAQILLPHSAFLEQAHIRSICTRVQFNAGGGNGEKCPKASIYGKARAISPLLDEPLKGPVFLRSSNNDLPDLVAALGSQKVNINLDGRIDSLNGRIRTTFARVPDAPVTKFVLEMRGGRKGLIVNSTDICKGRHRASANFKGQNGRQRLLNPVVKAKCAGKKGKRGGGRG